MPLVQAGAGAALESPVGVSGCCCGCGSEWCCGALAADASSPGVQQEAWWPFPTRPAGSEGGAGSGLPLPLPPGAKGSELQPLLLPGATSCELLPGADGSELRLSLLPPPPPLRPPPAFTVALVGQLLLSLSLLLSPLLPLLPPLLPPAGAPSQPLPPASTPPQPPLSPGRCWPAGEVVALARRLSQERG